MGSVRLAGAVLNIAVGAGTVTKILTFVPLESVTTTAPLPLFPAAAAIVNEDPFNDTLIRAGVSGLAE